MKKAGFSSQQAEGQVRVQAKVISALIEDKLATKDDSKAIKDELLDRMASPASKDELREAINAFRGEVREEISHLKAELKRGLLKSKNFNPFFRIKLLI